MMGRAASASARCALASAGVRRAPAGGCACTRRVAPASAGPEPCSRGRAVAGRRRWRTGRGGRQGRQAGSTGVRTGCVGDSWAAAWAGSGAAAVDGCAASGTGRDARAVHAEPAPGIAVGRPRRQRGPGEGGDTHREAQCRVGAPAVGLVDDFGGQRLEGGPAGALPRAGDRAGECGERRRPVESEGRHGQRDRSGETGPQDHTPAGVPVGEDAGDGHRREETGSTGGEQGTQVDGGDRAVEHRQSEHERQGSRGEAGGGGTGPEPQEGRVPQQGSPFPPGRTCVAGGRCGPGRHGEALLRSLM
ncbi:hypothetical protein SCANM63S_00873 [Streptomyces canarius]